MTPVTISCSGFSPSGDELTYFFAVSTDDEGAAELALGEVDGGDGAELTAALPPGRVAITIRACNAYDACAEVRADNVVESTVGDIDGDFVM